MRARIGGCTCIKGLDGGNATIAAVLEEMETHGWCHFACHGIQRLSNPTESSFALHDGELTLHTIMSKSFSAAELAFLSACQTATGDEKLSEESVHLAAGMLAAGYCSVFATLWSIKDEDAPLITEEVYTSLLDSVNQDAIENRDDRNRRARALHDAVKKLRDKVGEDSFVRWVPFVHFGV